MMSELIVWEMQYVAVTVTAGIFLAGVYDIFRILRRVFHHSWIAISIEDILFWMFAGVFSFAIFFIEDAGNVRGFAIAGELFGAMLYHLTISESIVKIIAFLLNLPQKIYKKALKKRKESYTMKVTDKE